MTQTFNQLAQRLASEAFQNQCLYAVLFLMRYINGESIETPNHANRIAWVHAGMADPFALARKMANMAISDGACNGDVEPTDEQVKTAIEYLVNVFAE